MQESHTRLVILAPHARLVGACAAFSASATVLGLLVAMFGAASSSPWLADTPDAIAQSATCDQAATRQARDLCMQQAALRWQAEDRQGLRLASSR
jgi:hypothetical protein